MHRMIASDCLRHRAGAVTSGDTPATPIGVCADEQCACNNDHARGPPPGPPRPPGDPMKHAISPQVRRQTIADALHRTALRLPDKLAIACGDTRWSYADFDALVSRLAAGLAHLGVAEGDKVAVLARNSHGFAALRFAIARRRPV